MIICDSETICKNCTNYDRGDCIIRFTTNYDIDGERHIDYLYVDEDDFCKRFEKEEMNN